MKQTLFIIFILFTKFGFSQFVSESDLNFVPREINSNLKNIHLVDSIIVNENTTKPYLSGVKFYNSLGKIDIKYEFNRKGDTIRTIKAIYPSVSLDIDVFKERKQINDTVFRYYNTNNQIKLEIWKWGEDKQVDSTKYYYNDSKKLDYKLDYYNRSEPNSSSSKTKQISYKNYNSRDSLSYHYNEKGLLTKVIMYDIKNNPFSEYLIEYGQKKIPQSITRITNDSFDSTKLLYKTVVEFEYYDNNYRKLQKETYFINNQFEETITWFYSQLGFIEKGQMKDINGKIIFERKITLHNNDYK